MALLNPPNVLPEAMRFIARAVIATKGRASEAELLDMIAPAGMSEAMSDLHRSDPDGDEGPTGTQRGGGRTIAECSLTALRQLGLVQLSDGKVSLGAQISSDWRKPEDVTTSAFVGQLEAAVLSENGAEIAADLLGTCAILAVGGEPLRPFDGFDEGTATRRFVEHQQSVLGTEKQADWAVGNKERWLSFRRIGPYLGWVEPMDSGGRFGLVPNAAPALRRWLNTVEPGTYTGGEFLRLVSQHLPFLDGGDHAKVQIGGSGPLSGGLSLSLLSLEHTGVLSLRQEADSPAMFEAVLGSGHSKLFSQVQVVASGEKKRKRS